MMWDSQTSLFGFLFPFPFGGILCATGAGSANAPALTDLLCMREAQAPPTGLRYLGCKLRDNEDFVLRSLHRQASAVLGRQCGECSAVLRCDLAPPAGETRKRFKSAGRLSGGTCVRPQPLGNPPNGLRARSGDPTGVAPLFYHVLHSQIFNHDCLIFTYQLSC